jgi:hypothetical protein
MDLGGTLFIVIDIVFVTALAAALAYGVMKWHSVRNDRRQTELRDRATRRNYEQDG